VIRKAISEKSKKKILPLPKVYEKKRLFKELKITDQTIWVLGLISLGIITVLGIIVIVLITTSSFKI
tara:strand:+ start:1571 stop:1771 length:201 start_codon:yes stop_codon:yes gene_type:complete